MKKLTLIAIAGLCAVAAAAWSVPASAAGFAAESHDKKPDAHGVYGRQDDDPGAVTSSAPEPGTMALLALGLGGLGLARRRRKD